MNFDKPENSNVEGVKDTLIADRVTKDIPSNNVEEEVVKKTAKEEKDEDMDREYVFKRSITIALINNYSLYRKANDKTLDKRRDYIGSSIRSSQVLSSNRKEVEAYFPQLLGISPNNENFVTRLKQYLNNIQVRVDELGVKFDCSFRFYHKRDYIKFAIECDKIEEKYRNADKSTLKSLKDALNIKINDLNLLESTLYQYGSPINLTEYILYRHCLLYRDIAKDQAIINSDPNIRFYLKDDVKDKERQIKLRNSINEAKRNYISIISDDSVFDAVYIQYCVLSGLPIISSLLKERIERETELDKFSTTEPVKFNNIVNDKNVHIKSLIEQLIARGELVRSKFNQNITTQDGEFVGANMKEAIAWVKNPKNEDVVIALKNKLKYI